MTHYSYYPHVPIYLSMCLCKHVCNVCMCVCIAVQGRGGAGERGVGMRKEWKKMSVCG